MTNLNELKVSLFPHPTDDEQDSYKGRIHLNGTVTNEHIALDVIAERSEFRYETILTVLNLCDAKKRDRLARGYAVADGVSHMYPSVTGVFRSRSAQFDPNTHSLGVTMAPAPSTRQHLRSVKVTVDGVAETEPEILKVEDAYTGAVNSIITPERQLKISGNRLFIVGNADVVGCWFVNVNNPELRIHVEPQNITKNMPTELIVITPSLAAGKYYMEIVTQYIHSNMLLFSKPGRSRFGSVLTVN